MAREKATMPKQVSYWGAEGCYSERAALNHFASKREEWETRPFSLLDKLFDAVAAGETELAILPLENSVTGTFHQVLDKLMNSKVQIVGEVITHDDACLLALPGVELKDIKNVLSHSSVLERCEKYLKSEIQPALTATTDTAGAALHIKLRGLRDTAAVASESVALLHGLNILAKNIDTGDCATRYVFVSNKSTPSHIAGTPNKTSIALSLTNRPGAMFKALACFALRDINVIKFESRPSNRSGSLYEITRPWEYLIYIDVDGSTLDEKVKCAISNLAEIAESVHVLGTYTVFYPPNATSTGSGYISGRVGV
eukprot:CFRG5127T1